MVQFTQGEPGSAIELAFRTHAKIGEGPSWDQATSTLLWVDILGCSVHRFNPTSGSNSTVSFAQQVGAVVPRSKGGLLLAVEDGFWVADDDGEPEQLALVEKGDPTTRMNDGKCDRRGRFWAGTMAHDAREKAGSLYRLDPDGSVDLSVSDVTISNGLGWSPDDTTMYYVDSVTHRIDVFDYDIDTGQATSRRLGFEVEEQFGLPDGIAVDGDGCIWIAFYQGWAVRRFTPEGNLDRTVSLPVANVTSCAFGGTDFGDLYITTASNGLDDADIERQPLAGSLFVHTPGDVNGLPETSFAG